MAPLSFESALMPLPPVSELMPLAEVAANENLAKVERRAGAAVGQVLHRVRAAVSPAVAPAQRTMQLRHLAGQWSALFVPDAACRQGCSHCCHINTDVPRAEAQLIAKKTGRKLASPVTHKGETDQDLDQYFGVPCPFLVQGSCSIYEHRPFVCRTLVNLAADAQLCELRPGESVPVPYANATYLKAAFFAVHSDDDWADIREWFPA